MYLTVTYSNSNRKRYITIPEDLTISQIQMLISAISVAPGVDKVWINFKEPGSNDEKANNNSGQS